MIATSNSLRPSRAVCIPPRCLTPRKSVSRAKNVTNVSPMTGHQDTFPAGSCGIEQEKGRDNDRAHGEQRVQGHGGGGHIVKHALVNGQVKRIKERTGQHHQYADPIHVTVCAAG